MNTGHEDRILIIHEVFSGVIHNYQQVFIPRGKHWYKVMEILIWMSLITAIVDKNNNKCLRYWNIGVSNQKWGQNAPRSPLPRFFGSQILTTSVCLRQAGLQGTFPFLFWKGFAPSPDLYISGYYADNEGCDFVVFWMRNLKQTLLNRYYSVIYSLSNIK